MKKVAVRDLVSVLRLNVLYGSEFLDKEIFSSELSRPGVELTGFFEYYPDVRIQLFGRTELSFLAKMDTERRSAVLDKLCHENVPVFVLSRSMEPPKEMVDWALLRGIPIVQAHAKTTSVLSNITHFLETKLAERISVHGVLVDVYGMGVLIQGDSGVGKSETALELIQKGHRLVADDRVDLYQLDELTLVGEAPDILKNLLEIRGVGIIDVMTLFGAGAIRATKKVDLIVNLELWTEGKKFERLGSVQETVRIMDVDVPKLSIPVKTGRNLAILVEIAAMNHRARGMGFNAAETFEKNLEKLIRDNSKK